MKLSMTERSGGGKGAFLTAPTLSFLLIFSVNEKDYS